MNVVYIMYFDIMFTLRKIVKIGSKYKPILIFIFKSTNFKL